MVTTMVTMAQQRVQGLSSTQRLLGYTLTDDISLSGAYFGQAGTYTIGAALEPADIAAYKGCTIVGIRLAAAVNLGRTRTFVYNFNGTALEPIAEQKQRIYEGWNVVFFNGDGYEIQGDETFFFGYDYVETQAMVDAEQGGLCCNGEETEGAFYLFGDYGQGEGLYSIGAGCLCVQLIVDVSSLPAHDMAVIYLDAGFKYKLPGASFEVMATMTSTGREGVQGYQLGYQIDDEAPVFVDRDEALEPGARDTWLHSITLPDDIATGHHTMSVFVSSINGEPVDAESAHKRLEAPFAIYRDSLDRQMAYLEIYTDQSSPYSAMLDETISYLKQQVEGLCVVKVHRPGTLLAVDDAAYLTELYAYTYPSFTINRSYFPGEDYVAYDMNYYLPVVGKELTAGILADMLWQDMQNPAFANLNLSGNYQSDTRQLTINVEGQLLPEAQAIYGDVALTLLLTENGVKSRQAVYNATTQRTTWNQNYKHDDVLRGYMTAPEGTPIEADGNTFKATFTTTLDAAWQMANMSVVGLLTKATDDVTAEPLTELDVINATCLPLTDLDQMVGIATPTISAARSVAGYTLDGRRAAKASKGIIVSNGRKVFVTR